MQFSYLYTAMVIILGSVLIQAAQKRIMLEIYDIDCQSLIENFTHFKCSFTKVENGKFLFNTSFMYDRKFGKDFDVHLGMRVTPWNGKVSYSFLDFRTNLCSILSQDLKNILVRKLVDELIRSSNYPLNCSFKANVIYKIEKYLLTDEFIPVYTPLINATFRAEFVQKSKVIASYVANLAVIPKK